MTPQEEAIYELLASNPGQWFTLTEIIEGTGLPIPVYPHVLTLVARRVGTGTPRKDLVETKGPPGLMRLRARTT